ncbi:MAG: hypothetical protein WAQ27_00900 [Candidatus Microsaccharimonas sp.]
MVKRVPAVTPSGAFTGSVLNWLDNRYGGSGAVTGTASKVPGVTTDGAFTGSVLNWLDNRYGGSGAVAGTASRLPAVSTDGSFSGKVLTWLDNRYGSGLEPSEYASVETPTAVINVAAKFTGGQTWTSATNIRTAFQAALDEAHALAYTDPNALVHIVLPPGVGKLTSGITTPINRSSTGTKTSQTTRQRFPSIGGFALRPNMKGRITFIGSGGNNQATTIQLSPACRNVFFADTDYNTVDNPLTWNDVAGKWLMPPRDATNFIPTDDESGQKINIVNQGTVATSGALPSNLNNTTDRGKAWVVSATGNYWVWAGTNGWRECMQSQKPSTRLVFQNYRFEKFCVDNNNTNNNPNSNTATVNPGNNHRGHTIFGFVIDFNTPQRYCSARNLTHSDIKTINYYQNPDEDLMATYANQAPFLYRTTTHEAFEANPGGNQSIWGDWNLNTDSGAQAAFAANWVFYHNLNFYDITIENATRGILVLQDITKEVSMWMDQINMYRCSHTQVSSYVSTQTQTSFYIGGNCLGGIGRIYNSRSENVADDGIEFGGMQKLIVRDYYSKNSQLDGILLRYSQIPYDINTTEVSITNWTHEITADAWNSYTDTSVTPSVTTGNKTRSRAVEVRVENEMFDTPLNKLTMNNVNYILDGTGGSNPNNPNTTIYNSLSNINSRVFRLGWQWDMPVKNLEVNTASCIINNIRTSSSTSTNNKVLPGIFYQGMSNVSSNRSQATAVFKNLSVTLSNVTAPTNPTRMRFIGLMSQTAGSLSVDGLSVTIQNTGLATEAIDKVDVATVGAVQDEWVSQRTRGEYPVGSVGTRAEYMYVANRNGAYSNHYNSTSTATDRAWSDSYAYPFAFTTNGVSPAEYDVNASDSPSYTYNNGTYTFKSLQGSTQGTVTAARRGLVVHGQNIIASATLNGGPNTTWSSAPYTYTTSDTKPNDTLVTGPMSDALSTPLNPVAGQDYSNNWYIGDKYGPTLPAVQLYYYADRANPVTISPNPNAGKLTVL